MAYKVFIDGQAGTTGLRLAERLAGRPDIELIEIAEDVRKDMEARLSCIAAADVSILCLPDDGAREIVAALDAVAKKDGPDAPLAKSRIIDCSTAFRTARGWTYGMPEIVSVDERTRRVANPGCHATGYILAILPLAKAGIVNKTATLSFHTLTGYSGGGKAMIAEYEGQARAGRGVKYEGRGSVRVGGNDPLAAPRQYGLSQEHKHLPEIQKYAGLDAIPIFAPIVCDFYNGMLVSVSLPRSALRSALPPHKKAVLESVRDILAEYYEGCPLIKVRAVGAESTEAAGSGYLSANAFANRDDLELFVTGREDRIDIITRYDNLGKGASGAAIQNLNRMLGIPEETGLVLGDL